MSKKPLSAFSVVIIILVILGVHWNLKMWKWDKKVIYWDIVSYYAYLPAYFIYDDITLQFTKNGNEDEGGMNYIFWPQENEEGELIIKTTMGISMLYSPFFFMGHLYALNSSYEASGFSQPYKVALLIGAVFWLLIALIFLRKSLLKYFSDAITAIVLFIIVFGTNLLFYSTVEATMSHVFNFSLFSIFLFLTIKWEEKQNWKISLLIGLLAGVITLARPTNLLIILVFILFNVYNKTSFIKRIKYLLSNWKQIFLMILAGSFVIFFQLLYWKTVSGDWFYYSYGNEERFFWNQPHIIDGLFSYRKGWLVYTPVMIFSLAGFFFIKKYMKELNLALPVFFLINIYIIFSWWSWWYGGSFGLRALIESYALLAFPLAAFLTYVSEQKMLIKSILFSLVFLFTSYNLFATGQYFYGAIHWDSMTKEAYWESFGKLRPSEKFYELLKTPDYEAARKGEEQY